MIEKVISGFQTGADQGGIRAARRLGIPTGGTMPKSFRTETGSRFEFAELYGAVAHESFEYGPRTQCNVDDSDITIYVRRNNQDSLGFWKTKNCAQKSHKPFWDITEPKFGKQSLRGMDFNEVFRFFSLFNYKIINIAGTRESKDPGIGEWAEEFVYQFLRLSQMIEGKPGA